MSQDWKKIDGQFEEDEAEENQLISVTNEYEKRNLMAVHEPSQVMKKNKRRDMEFPISNN